MCDSAEFVSSNRMIPKISNDGITRTMCGVRSYMCCSVGLGAIRCEYLEKAILRDREDITIENGFWEECKCELVLGRFVRI